MQNEIYEIVKIHICNFEKKDDCLKVNLNDFPERLCVIDNKNDVVIDVETKHKYPYIRTISMMYFLNEMEAKKITIGKRVACFEYSFLSLSRLNSKELIECEKIIESLKQGIQYPDGNDILTNEQYLALINKTKIHEEPIKTLKKRKKRK